MNSDKLTIPAILAVGGTLAASPATAIELGEISVQSTLGQPLRASIAYALAPGEQLSDYCVTLHRGPAASGLPSIRNASITVAGGVISLTGRAAVREPLMSVRVNIACPYTPQLSREYMLFIDPALPAVSEATPQPVAAATAPVPQVAEERPPASPPAVRRPASAKASIATESRYRVQRGDTLSGIASRIQNRPIGLWSAVTAIFDANPDAFIDSDPNKLKAGSWLSIPDLGNGAAVVTDRAATPPRTIDAAVPDVRVAEPAAVAKSPAADTARVSSGLPPAAEAAASVERAVADAELDRENPFVDIAPAEDFSRTNPVIDDTSMDIVTEATSPNVPVARIPDEPVARPAPEGRSNWLLWLIGGGIALLAGLLLFGRRSRIGHPDPYADAEADHPMRRSSDSATVETLADADYELDDDAPTAENLALDADLSVGTGLDAGTEVEVRQDFGFAATTDLDFDLTSVDEDENDVDTDMLIAPTVEQLTVLDSEALPDDDEYDMSVIVDATKMPRPDEVTGKDLRAVAVENTDDTEEYTLDQEIDYQILEQDYEDELTATQALNKEIEKAAAELIDPARAAEASDLDATGIGLASVTEIDATSRLPDQVFPAESYDFDVELTQEMPSDELTVEMPKSDNDDTVEDDEIDTKAG